MVGFSKGETTMSRTILIAALAAFVAAPAAAAGSQQSAPAKAPRAATAKGGEKKYCLVIDKVTGSRVEKTECKTKRQWAWDGVNVDELTN